MRHRHRKTGLKNQESGKEKTMSINIECDNVKWVSNQKVVNGLFHGSLNVAM